MGSPWIEDDEDEAWDETPAARYRLDRSVSLGAAFLDGATLTEITCSRPPSAM